MTSLSNLARSFFLVRPETLAQSSVEHKRMPEGTTDIVGFNFAPVKSLNETTVSSSTWETDDANVTLSSASSTAISTQVTVSADSSGSALLKNTITMSDSQKVVRYLKLDVFKIKIIKDYAG